MSDVYDVAVVGGGPSGIGAAVGAARSGAKVVLVERNPILGGMGTVALVNNFCNAHHDGNRFVIGGVFGDLRERLIRENALFVTGGLEPFNHHVYLQQLEQLLEEAGVEVRVGCGFDSVECAAGRIGALRLTDGSRLRARAFVDTTGDALLAQQAGVAFTAGRDSDGAVMPLTWCYLLGPIDREKLRAAIPDAFLEDLRTGEEYIYIGRQQFLRDRVAQARRTGELTIPRDRIAVAYSMPGIPDAISVNFGRVRVSDPTDAVQMAAANEEGLRQVEEGRQFFRNHVPGFEAAEVMELARQIGVRESRQIVGLYRLSGEDVLAGRQFADVIAQGKYSIDIHNPLTDTTEMRGLGRGEHYDIPLRALIPASGAENLVVGGRCICATQEAMSSFRVLPSAMAIGEAAGVAATVCARTALPMKAVPYAEVRRLLLAGGAVLE